MRISFIIPNYNGENLLKKNLPEVLKAVKYYQERTQAQVELIIVDDFSTDNSLEEIQSLKFKVQNYNLKLKIIKNERNLGFSATVNRGVREAQGEIVILLNTDVFPEKDFLEPLLKHFDDPKIFAVGCMDKSVENGKTVLRGRGIGRWEKGFLIHSRGEVDKANTLWVNGGSGAFSKSIWEKLGGFDQIYNPFYWEDIDLSYRALKSGYSVLFEPKSIVVHEHEKGSIKKKYSVSQIKVIVYRNQFVFVWRNITDLNLKFSHVFWLPYHFMKALIQKDWELFLGFFKALIFFQKIIQSNSRTKKFFAKKDSEIIKDFKK